MEEIMKSIVEIFNLKIDIIKHIRSLKSQKEDWFLAELSYMLKNDPQVYDIEIEHKIGNRGIDLAFKNKGLEYFIEIKHWVDRYRSRSDKKYSSYKLSSYLGNNGAYWKNDFTKLLEIKNTIQKSKCFFMVFYTRYDDEIGNIKISMCDFIKRLAEKEFFKENRYIPRIYCGKSEYYYILTIEIV